MKTIFNFQLSIFNCLLLLALLPTGHLAAQTNHDINTGGNLVISGDGTYTITGTGSATNNTITVQSGVTAHITLNGVNIDVSGTEYACAF
ncbi:MAG: hypothetical protein LBG31_02625, partial [Prevotellaceae bacterium]|nr:hypothetical protein [Prevotellaceae bacterium]